MTSVAIGPAVSPPKQPVQRSIVAATAIWGSSAGEKPMNHGWLRLASTSISAVPVLPASVAPPPTARSRSPSATLVIISATSAAVSSLITRENSSKSVPWVGRPSGRSPPG